MSPTKSALLAAGGKSANSEAIKWALGPAGSGSQQLLSEAVVLAANGKQAGKNASENARYVVVLWLYHSFLFFIYVSVSLYAYLCRGLFYGKNHTHYTYLTFTSIDILKIIKRDSRNKKLFWLNSSANFIYEHHILRYLFLLCLHRIDFCLYEGIIFLLFILSHKFICFPVSVTFQNSNINVIIRIFLRQKFESLNVIDIYVSCYKLLYVSFCMLFSVDVVMKMLSICAESSITLYPKLFFIHI